MAPGPYPERRDNRETRADRLLLAASARLKRPFSRALARAAHVARLVEQVQKRADALSDAGLREAADALRARFVREGFAPDPVAHAFALVRAAARRTLGIAHFPVQLMGGYVILQGMLAEMATGEGKTLTATLPAATAALAGMPVHMVTVNDYLAQRDGSWMRPVYAALGLEVGIAQPGQAPHERRAVYAADIAYCTNKDIGFDYLRDGLALSARRSGGQLLLDKLLGRANGAGDLLLRGLYFAIVDEADSVLVDEARTPLIIAGASDAREESELFPRVLALAAGLERDLDYRLDAGERTVRLTDRGRERVEAAADAFSGPWQSARAREELIEQALSALHLFQRDVHYLVREGKVQIVDEYTGRVLADRSWERGLQQMVEAKEGCEITGRQSTLARITYQRLFRRYLRLGGMTGTAIEVAAEVEAVYALKCVRIPSHRPVRRTASGARLFARRAQKWAAVAQRAAALAAAGRPVLIGTRSIAESEALSAVLNEHGVDHVVLNARQDGEEAQVVAQAGTPGRVTVATNMAGRGTDIHLGTGVAQRGGLHVILTEYHDSRRIDRQLYGRCARQGEPGSCEAILSLEDELFVRYAPRLTRIMDASCGARDRPLPGSSAALLRWVGQRAAEAANMQARRSTLESDRKLEQSMAFAGRPE